MQVRELLTSVEQLRAQKNDLAQQAKSGITDHLRETSLEVGKMLKKEQELQLQILQKQYQEKLLACPNIPRADVPEGNKEANQVVKTW